MRLLFAHDHRFHVGAGGELYTLGSFPSAFWSRYLEHFEEVHVIARNGGALEAGAKLSRAEHPGVTFEFIPSLSSFRQLLFRSSGTTSQMRAAVEAADAVVARLPSEVGLLAVTVARALGKPYAIEVVGCAWDACFNHGALSGRFYAPVAFARMRKAISNAPLALYVTSSWLQYRYPTKGQRGSASNVTLETMSAKQESNREARLGALQAGQPPVLGTVASLWVKSKGIQTAMKALSRLRNSGLDLDYRILGSGPVKPWKQLAHSLGIGDLVHFDGTRSAGKEVASWLDQIDIHLQPSFQEGLPRATIEAMSRGAACAGSTCGGIPELLPLERLHKPGDVAALAEAIRRLATDPDATAAASRSDRETSRQFDPDVLKARRRDFYARLKDMARRKPASRKRDGNE